MERIEPGLKYNLRTCFFAIVIAIAFECLFAIIGNAIFYLIYKIF